MYVCETWSTIESYENKLLTFKRKVLKNIYESTKNVTTGDYKRRKYAHLDQIYKKLNIKYISYAKKLKRAGNMW